MWTFALAAVITAIFRAAAAGPSPMGTVYELSDLLGVDPIVMNDKLENEYLESRHPGNPEIKRVKTRYGPFTIPPMTDNNGMKEFLQQKNVPKPCDDCTIISAQPGLVFTDGTYANANTSMWLHHIMLFNSGKIDTTCPYLPERMIASGNERTEHRYTVEGLRKAGYYLGQKPLIMLAELMNVANHSRDAVITYEWDYVAGSPDEYARLTPLWLDVSGICGSADVTVPSGQDTFTYKLEPPWRSTISGEVLLTGGHVHDGGIRTELIKNGQVICDSVAGYGERPEFMEPADGMNMDMGAGINRSMEIAHMSSMTVCRGLGPAKVGDEWSVHAFYNLTEHRPMMGSGAPLDVMGNVMVYIAEST